MRVNGRKRKLFIWATTCSTTAVADRHYRADATCKQKAPWGGAAAINGIVTRGGGGTNAAGNEDDASLGREGSVFLAAFEREVRQARQDLEQETIEAFEQLRRKILVINREKAEMKRKQRQQQEEQEKQLEELERQRREEEDRRRQETPVDQDASARVEADASQEKEGQPKATSDAIPSLSQDSIADELPEVASNDKADEKGSAALRGLDELEDNNAADDLAIPQTSLNEDTEGFQSFERIELFQEGDEALSQDFVVGDSDEEPDAVLSRVRTGSAGGPISSDGKTPLTREQNNKVHSESGEMSYESHKGTTKEKAVKGGRNGKVVSGGAKAKMKKHKRTKEKMASLSSPVTRKSSKRFDAARDVKKKKRRKKLDTAVQSISAESDQMVKRSAPGPLWKVVFKGFMLLIVYFLTTVLVRLVLNSVMARTA